MMVEMTLDRFITATLACCTLLGAQIEAPERKVGRNVVASESGPAVRIELPLRVSYVGGDRWILYGIADCEIHVFVEADQRKRVQRLYWVQFEGYLPSRPDLRYAYPFSRTIRLDSMDFDVKARFGSNDEPPKPGSDLERVRALIRARGYRLPQEMMNVRLVHLADQNKRKELMIIYAEDLKPTGFTVAELLPGAKAEDQWPTIEKGLIERAKNNLKLRNMAQH
jgi:hypothetical protein